MNFTVRFLDKDGYLLGDQSLLFQDNGGIPFFPTRDDKIRFPMKLHMYKIAETICDYKNMEYIIICEVCNEF